MTKKKEIRKFSYSVQKCLEANTSKMSFNDLNTFLVRLQELDAKASKKTHYEKLDEWLDTVYDFLHKQLNKYGFINGGAAMGKEQPTDAAFWWAVYNVMSSVIYSIHLKSVTEYHHSSAWERSQALMADIQDIIEFKPSKTKMV